MVIAGLPGAGKSTALTEVQARVSVTELAILDSASVRTWLQARLPRVPYRVLRPLVHVTHGARIAVSAVFDPRPLVVHDTATRAVSRRALRALARCGRRPARLVWIEVSHQTARRGQIDRKRLIRSRAFARHVRRVRQAHPATAADSGAWDVVARTDRDGATQAILTACTVVGHRTPAPALEVSCAFAPPPSPPPRAVCSPPATPAVERESTPPLSPTSVTG